MYCKNCGKNIDDNASVCFYCGVVTDKGKSDMADKGSAGWGVLGFFFPLIGFILFLVWHHTKPKSAKSAGIGALIGVILYVVFVIIYVFAIAALVGSLMSLSAVPTIPLF